MFLFRAVFIIATVFVAFVAQVSAIPPLTRFMLDAIPEGSEDGTDPNVLPSGADPSTSVSVDSDVPVASESSPVQEDPAVESPSAASNADPNAADLSVSSAVSVPSSPTNSPVSQTNAAGHIGVVGSTTALIGAVVVGMAFAI
ncbi:hypothetical protein LXA43DRAFT_1005492 [Ganoderma leucocontextum]|nr:hypothetical protein LXA43DRAFT_1005492 [Ganoderma leucocontextum]